MTTVLARSQTAASPPSQAVARAKAWALLNLEMTAYLAPLPAFAAKLRVAKEYAPPPPPPSLKGWIAGENVEADVTALERAMEEHAKVVALLQSTIGQIFTTVEGFYDGFALERPGAGRPRVSAVHAYTYSLLFLWRAADWGDPTHHDIRPPDDVVHRLVERGVLKKMAKEWRRWDDSLEYCTDPTRGCLDLAKLPPLDYRGPFTNEYAPEALWLVAEAQRLRAKRDAEGANGSPVTPRDLFEFVVGTVR